MTRVHTLVKKINQFTRRGLRKIIDNVRCAKEATCQPLYFLPLISFVRRKKFRTPMRTRNGYQTYFPFNIHRPFGLFMHAFLKAKSTIWRAWPNSTPRKSTSDICELRKHASSRTCVLKRFEKLPWSFFMPLFHGVSASKLLLSENPAQREGFAVKLCHAGAAARGEVHARAMERPVSRRRRIYRPPPIFNRLPNRCYSPLTLSTGFPLESSANACGLRAAEGQGPLCKDFCTTAAPPCSSLGAIRACGGA